MQREAGAGLLLAADRDLILIRSLVHASDRGLPVPPSVLAHVGIESARTTVPKPRAQRLRGKVAVPGVEVAGVLLVVVNASDLGVLVVGLEGRDAVHHRIVLGDEWMHLGTADRPRHLHKGVPVEVLAPEEYDFELQQQLVYEVAESWVSRFQPNTRDSRKCRLL